MSFPISKISTISFKDLALPRQTEKPSAKLQSKAAPTQNTDPLKVNQTVNLLKTSFHPLPIRNAATEGKENQRVNNPEAPKKMNVCIKNGVVLQPSGAKFTPRLLHKFFPSPNLFPTSALPANTKSSSNALTNQWIWKQVITDCAERFSSKINGKNEDSNSRIRTFSRIGSFSFSLPHGPATSLTPLPLPSEKPKANDSFEFAKPLPRAPKRSDLDSPTKALNAVLSLSSIKSTQPLSTKDPLKLSSLGFPKPPRRNLNLKNLLELSSPYNNSKRAALTPEREWTHFMDEIHIPKSARVHFSTLLKTYLSAKQDLGSLAFQTALSDSPITQVKALEFLDLFKNLYEKRRANIEEFLSQAP